MIQPQFESASDFSEGLASVRIIDRWGFINRSGQIVIKPQFQFPASFSDGIAAVTKNRIDFYIDKNGNQTTTPQFKDFFLFLKI
ncbi:hypothetical protein LEP1GSC127_0156 [Leptospira kirschneri str. 200801925]|nr:hypothetical protein LEP1GSC127_0156 [Leptospira kirschneri str. 200801925]